MMKSTKTEETTKMKSCTKCQSSENGFFKDSRLKSGYKSICKNCDVKYKRSPSAVKRCRATQFGKVTKNKKANDAKYRSSPKGLLVAKNQKYKRRSIIGQGKIKLHEWQSLMQVFDEKCAYCLIGGEMTIDHIKPISKGGLNAIENILPACRSCNSKKQSKPFEVFCSEEIKNRILTTLTRLNTRTTTKTK